MPGKAVSGTIRIMYTQLGIALRTRDKRGGTPALGGLGDVRNVAVPQAQKSRVYGGTVTKHHASVWRVERVLGGVSC